MKANLNIPPRGVRVESGILRKDQVARDFARQMTHELRTPLNVIIGLCQYLERDLKSPLNEGQRDTVIRIERNAHALLASVTRLLECVRSGKYDA